jgi:hypothetical protein
VEAEQKGRSLLSMYIYVFILPVRKDGVSEEHIKFAV